MYLIEEFVKESNNIEGIIREPTGMEIEAHIDMYYYHKVGIKELEKFVKKIQPDARLRDDWGLDVQVGNHRPPAGNPGMRKDLEKLLNQPYDAFNMHIKYETLHPFTDGNGRSGRALWLNQMQDISLGFLHMFYYQTLQNSRAE